MEEAIFIISPVLGLRPFLAFLLVMVNVPKPGRVTFLPFLRFDLMASVMESRASPACLRVRSVCLEILETSSFFVIVPPFKG